jgi:hypothetical protein
MRAIFPITIAAGRRLGAPELVAEEDIVWKGRDRDA